MTKSNDGSFDTLELENFDHLSFVSFNKLEALFIWHKIYELLQEHDVEYYFIDEIVNKVIDGGIRTFVILMTIDDIRSITRLIQADHHFSDAIQDRLFVRRQ